MHPHIQCSDLFQRLFDEEVLVIDCRSDEEWLGFGAHIPGALRVAPTELAEVVDVLPEDELIVLCGNAADGKDLRRPLKLLQLRGRAAVCLQGGLSEWITRGYPTEHHHAPVAMSEGDGVLEGV